MTGIVLDSEDSITIEQQRVCTAPDPLINRYFLIGNTTELHGPVWLVESLHVREPLIQRTNYKLHSNKHPVVQGSTV